MNDQQTELPKYKFIMPNAFFPELSEWQCYMFGMGPTGICFRPPKGKEPNWFWRKMQYLVFGNKWVKATK